ncbi:MAG: DMT family transporter [Patescibacteria group bacterium]|jgi:drug/metabolite transporter (DMT)-like permease
MQSHTKTAIVLALGTAVISGVANFVNKFGLSSSGDPVVYTLVKNGVAALFCISVVVAVIRRRELKQLRRSDWLKLLLIGGVGGSIPFILFFTGLAQTTAVSASFIHKSLFLWVALLAVPLLKERIGMLQGVALALLLVGNGFIGKVTRFGRGEILIMIATLLWAVETVIIKHVLKNISSWTVAAARMGIGAVILFGVVAFQGKLDILGDYSLTQWGWTALTGLILFGYVVTWTAALKRAPVTLVASLLVPAAFITSLCSSLYSGQALTSAEWYGAMFFVVGSVLLFLSYRTVNHIRHDRTQPSHS